MGKRSHKRQKTSTKDNIQPLGSRTFVDDTTKDDEERRLESMLFGVPYVPSEKSRDKREGDDTDVVISDVEDSAAVGNLKELENMLDSDLFFIDDNAGSSSIKAPAPDEGPSAFSDRDSGADSIEVEEEPLLHEQDTLGDAATTDHGQETSLGNTLQPGTCKEPAWVDPDDANLQVSLTSHTRLRKLRDAPAEDTVGGREYERRLRRQYEQINPTPDWASKARRKLHPKRRRSTSDPDPEDEVEDIIPDLLASTGGISGGKKIKVLTPGIISVDRLRDANQAAPAEGEIKSLQFHPSPQIPVLLTASTDRRLRLFHVDGLTNPHAQTLHIPSLPLTNATFHPTGSSILLTGPRPFYYTYDLQSGTSHRSPRGLWGSTSGVNQDASMDTCAFSPTGDVLAVAGRRGHIHLVDWRSGAAQVIAGLKANAGIRSLWWSRRGDGPSELLSLTEDSQVYVWDIGQRRSNTGLVNVYSADSTVSPQISKPKPLKTLGNLTTNISCLSYNHDSQLLAMASNVKTDQMRLIHLPSLTVFGNWPTTKTPLGHVTAMNFSTGSEYLVIGNNRGRVLLYQLRDYGDQ
ncbi:WD40-repeat-containing domain protein [Butyriboletus roseoflavus]|nr:WD40-repeat-containing domain protein [Butyriboletus roseoflavus]